MKINSSSSKIRTEGSITTGVATLELNSVIAHVLSRDLYTRPIEAAIREVFINAIDAHEEAGQTRPVEMQLPTRSDDTFYVRDYGRGLSHEDMMRIYLDYGKSTRRDDNIAHGGLGLGTKAPLAYTDAFAVESYHGGEKRSYLIYYNEDGLPTRDLRSVEPTDETGLKVSFSVRHASEFSEFHNAAIAILQFVPQDKYVVNLPHVKEKAHPDNLGMSEHGPVGLRLGTGVEVRMGFQRYLVDLAALIVQFSKNQLHCQLTAGISISLTKAISALAAKNLVSIRLPIGAIQPHPSRESVIVTRNTANIIAAEFANGLKELFSDFADPTLSSIPNIQRDVVFFMLTGDTQSAERFDGLKLRARLMDTPAYSWYPRSVGRIISEYSELIVHIARPNFTSSFAMSLLSSQHFTDYLGHGAGSRENPADIDASVPILVFDHERTDPAFLDAVAASMKAVDLTAAAEVYIRGVEYAASSQASNWKRTRNVTRSMQDPKHNLLTLNARQHYHSDYIMHGSAKRHWTSAEKSVADLKALNRPVFWAVTRMGCAEDAPEVNAVSFLIDWLSPGLPPHMVPLIIGLPASKGTKRFERAFPNIEEFHFWVDKLLETPRWRRIFTVQAINDSFRKYELRPKELEKFSVDADVRDLSRYQNAIETISRLSISDSLIYGYDAAFKLHVDATRVAAATDQLLKAITKVPMLSIRAYVEICSSPDHRYSGNMFCEESRALHDALRDRVIAHIIKLNQP